MEAPRDSSSGAPAPGPAPARSENTAQPARDSRPSEEDIRRALVNIDIEIDLYRYIDMMRTLWTRAQDKQTSSVSAALAAEGGTESSQQVKAAVLASLADQLPASGQKTYPLISTGASRFGEMAREWIERVVADVAASGGGQSLLIDFLVYTHTHPEPDDPHNHALVRVWVSGGSTHYSCHIGHVHTFAPEEDFGLSGELPKYLGDQLAQSLDLRRGTNPMIRTSSPAEKEGERAFVYSHIPVSQALQAWSALVAIDHFIRHVQAGPSDASATEPSGEQEVNKDLEYYLEMAIQLVGRTQLLKPDPVSGKSVVYRERSLGYREWGPAKNRDDEHENDMESTFSSHYYKEWSKKRG